MAHNINSMMYVGDKPWHKLGTELPQVATAAEAIAAAGLGWKVEKRPIYFTNDQGAQIAIPGKFATVRMDTQDSLGVVGDGYNILQNPSAFSLTDALVKEKMAMYHTAGALGRGERIWMLAKLPGHIRVVGDDITEKYLLLTNSHDGTTAVQIMFTPIRVVCQNTLNVAIAGGEKKAYIRHVASMGAKVKEVRDQLGIINEHFAQFETAAKALAGKSLKSAGLTTFLDRAGILKRDDDKELTGQTKTLVEEISKMFEHGRGNDMKGVKGTLWAAFNAVSEYVDYSRPTRGDVGEGRAKSLLFGSGALMKQRAWDAAVTMAK